MHPAKFQDLVFRKGGFCQNIYRLEENKKRSCISKRWPLPASARAGLRCDLCKDEAEDAVMQLLADYPVLSLVFLFVFYISIYICISKDKAEEMR